MIKVMADSGGTVSYNASDLGAGLNTFANNQDYIFQGVEDEMLVTYSATSFQISVGKGRGIICGRPITIESPETFTLPANTSNIYLIVRADLTQAIGQEGYLTYATSSQLRTDNLNTSGGQKHDLKLALISTNSSGVSSFVDKRSIFSESSKSITVDSALSSTSTNPVQNKVINAKFSNHTHTKSQITDFPTSMTPTSHTHGYIKNDGTVEQSSVASGDQIVITDASYSGKIVKSNITFGSTTTTFLSNAGTWLTPAGTGISVTTLWTNPNPTTAATDIVANIAASSYKLFVVLVKPKTTSSTMYPFVFTYDTGVNPTVGTSNYPRKTTIASNKITFTIIPGSSGQPIEYADNNIPYRLYGIK